MCCIENNRYATGFQLPWVSYTSKATRKNHNPALTKLKRLSLFKCLSKWLIKSRSLVPQYAYLSAALAWIRLVLLHGRVWVSALVVHRECECLGYSELSSVVVYRSSRLYVWRGTRSRKACMYMRDSWSQQRWSLPVACASSTGS